MSIGDSIEFRPIANHPHYRVSATGRVQSRMCRVTHGFRDEWRDLKPFAYRGYLHVKLTPPGGVARRYPIHRLVLEAFVGPCPEGMECRHLDGNRGNNNLPNLAWGTKKENHDDQKRHGTAVKGERVSRAILTAERVRKIRSLATQGHTIREIADALGHKYKTIWNVIVRYTWKHI